MELFQLRQFKAIAESENITKAARLLYVSQSALSQNLQKLEDELGVRLFDRVKKNIRLNENGVKLLRHAELILSEVKACEEEFKKDSADISYVIATTSFSALWYFTSRFRRFFEDKKVNAVIAPHDEIALRLLEGQIDAGVVSAPIPNDEIENIFLIEDRFVITVSQNHPLAVKDEIELSELSECDILVVSDTTKIGVSYIQSILKEKRLTGNITTVGEGILLYDLAKANDKYVTFASSLEIKHNTNFYSRRKVLKIKDRLKTLPIYVAYKKSNYKKLEYIDHTVNHGYRPIMNE